MKRSYWIITLLILALATIGLTGCSQPASTTPEAEQPAAEGGITLTLEDFKATLDAGDALIVDARQSDIFNGWTLEGDAFPGHVKGAISFDADWIDTNSERLPSVLESKGMVPEAPIVLYDTNGEDAAKLSAWLTSQGFSNIKTFDLNASAGDTSLTFEAFENYAYVAPAQAVKALIESDPSVLVFEASWGEVSESYSKGHLPRAVHINTDEVEEGPIWNRLSDDRLIEFAKNNGITKDSTVVLYGDDSMAAYRIAVILKYMGVEKLHVLNGGTPAWTKAGYALETTANAKAPVTDFGAAAPLNPGYIVDLEEAKALLADTAGSVLVDNRSWAEHIGETSGYSYIEGKGRPAGAVFGYAGTDNSNLDDFRNVDLTMRDPNEIEAMWADAGITRDKNLSFFCGTGWRAAEILMYADVLDFNKISLYDGGWNEWQSLPELPIETGEPK